MKRLFLHYIALSGLLISSATAQNVGFERSAYGLGATGELAAKIVIKPVPPAGLFGAAVFVRVQGTGISGFAEVEMVPQLSFHGPRAGKDPNNLNGLVFGQAQGTTDFAAAQKAYFGSHIATMRLSGLPEDQYTLSVSPYRVLGVDSQATFVDGAGNVLDPNLSFGTASLTVGVIGQLDVSAEPVLNRQSGLYQQDVVLTNVTGVRRGNFRIYVDDLPAGIVLSNAHGNDGGRPYVDYLGELNPNGSVTLRLEYYDRTRRGLPTPTLSVIDSAGGGIDPNPSNAVPIAPRLSFAGTGDVLLEFDSVAGAVYFIQYTTDLTNWITVQSPVNGNGSKVQWIDNGPPKTDCHPRDCRTRFYRLIRNN